LKALAEVDDSRLEDALKTAQADSDEDLRRTATLLRGKVKSSNAAVSLSATLEQRLACEKQAACAALGALPDPAADDVLTGWLHATADGGRAREIQLDLIEAAEKRSSAAVREKLEKISEVEAPRRSVGGVSGSSIRRQRGDGKRFSSNDPKPHVCAVTNQRRRRRRGPRPQPCRGAKGPAILSRIDHCAEQADCARIRECLGRLNSGTVYAGVLKSETAANWPSIRPKTAS